MIYKIIVFYSVEMNFQDWYIYRSLVGMIQATRNLRQQDQFRTYFTECKHACLV